MKNPPSRYVLIAEILVISLFHLMKFKQAEKHPAEAVVSLSHQQVRLQKPLIENRSATGYMLVNLVK